ncbi:Flagellar protein FliS [Desulfamplus magnetovallimortis]|uniref:Flagellar protein FliS n=1 Tax=Desulfamplus magnetovallimortis TaxID=1246637 RepID=A0A1W1HA01_9BACT|nr:flagellar export chaperone FliS [Desulfamplus magnetovallimortis]SLM29208.1 Flagellar protein FliS [Desulfamplus magnetovallimortis]
MRQPAGMQKYMNNHYDGMTPEQLILMLYKGALQRLQLVKQAIEEKNIQKRGENLSKVIAIISELNSSLNTDGKDDSIKFLGGLYMAMLVELPKVSINNDIETIERTARYIEKLKEIWETSVMSKASVNAAAKYPSQAAYPRQQKAASKSFTNNYGNQTQARLNAFAV